MLKHGLPPNPSFNSNSVLLRGLYARSNIGFYLSLDNFFAKDKREQS